MKRRRNLLALLTLAFRILVTVSNPWAVVLDLLGYRFRGAKLFVINTYQGLKFTCRVGTTDIKEILVLISGIEYPWSTLVKVLKPKSVLDLGAHIGGFSLWAKWLWPAAKVLAIEPENSNYQVLVNNIGLNKLNIEARRVAVGSANGEGQLVGNGDTDAWQIAELSKGITTKDNLVEVMTLKTLYGQFQPQLVKVDIEGAEYLIFTDENKDIFKQINCVVMEVHEAPINHTAVKEKGEFKFIKDYFAVCGHEIIFENDHILVTRNVNY